MIDVANESLALRRSGIFGNTYTFNNPNQTSMTIP